MNAYQPHHGPQGIEVVFVPETTQYRVPADGATRGR